MAVLTRFSTKKNAPAASIRYAVHRVNEEGEAQYREIFDRDSDEISKEDAFKKFDQDKLRYTYTIILNPGQKDMQGVDMRKVTREVMQSLEDKGMKTWIAVEHKDHTEYDHVHIVAKSAAKLSPEDFKPMRQDQFASFERQAEPLRDTWRNAERERQAQRDQEAGR